MARDLPKSSRPDRRKKSGTFPHPYQLHLFDPPLASTLRGIGNAFRLLIPAYLGLWAWYHSNAQQLPDGADLKVSLALQASTIFVVMSALIVVEIARTLEGFDYKWLGYGPKYVMVALIAVAAGYLIYAYHAYGSQTWAAHQQRVQDAKRMERERLRVEGEHERQRKEAEAECVAQKGRDVETLTRRRAAASQDHRTCIAEWVKPGFFSNETPEQACAAKKDIVQRLTRELKERQSKDCTPR